MKFITSQEAEACREHLIHCEGKGYHWDFGLDVNMALTSLGWTKPQSGESMNCCLFSPEDRMAEWEILMALAMCITLHQFREAV